MHEILDPFEGQPKTSSIEFLNTQIRYYHELEKLRLHRLKIVQIQNLHPWSEFQKLPTLFLNFGFKKANDLLCYLCTVPNFTMSWGSTHQIGTHSTLSLLINTDLTYSSQYIKNSISVGIGLKLIFFTGGDHLQLLNCHQKLIIILLKIKLILTSPMKVLFTY